MEKYQEARDKALKNLKIADHMLNVTYPLVKDPKLLMAVVDNMFLALTNSMAAILHFEALYKRVPIFKDDFETKFNLLKTKCAERLNIEKEFLSFILDIKNMVLQHKKSPVEFVKKDKFIICSDNYQLRTVSLEGMKSYLEKTRRFVYLTNNIITQNVRLY